MVMSKVSTGFRGLKNGVISALIVLSGLSTSFRRLKNGFIFVFFQHWGRNNRFDGFFLIWVEG